MAVIWASFRYSARLSDPELEYAELAAGTPPEVACQAERHLIEGYPAAWLEVFYSTEGENMTVHRAWFTCSGCHAKIEAEYEPSN